MKNLFTKTSFLMVLLLSMGSITFAQTPDPYLFDDFEPGSVNSAGICTDDVNTSLPPIGWNRNGTDVPSIAANPDKSGINLSNTVMYCFRSLTGVAWAGPKIDDAEWGTAFADTWGAPITGYNYMHIKMYCNKVTKPGVNLQIGEGDAGPVEGTVITPYTWIDVVFDISKYSAVDRILILIDQSDPLTEVAEVYLDDIILTNDPTPITTGITKVMGDNVAIFADNNGVLHISGSNDAATIYNLSGQTIYHNASAKNLSVELVPGLYIVKAGATTKKVLVQ